MGYAVWPRLFKKYFIQLLSLMLQYACVVPSKILCLFLYNEMLWIRKKHAFCFFWSG